MQAIVTKYFGPTNHNGARIKATAQAGSKTIPWDHALSTEANHLAAAEALANMYDWLDPRMIGDSYRTVKMVHGVLPDGNHVYVLVPDFAPVAA